MRQSDRSLFDALVCHVEDAGISSILIFRSRIGSLNVCHALVFHCGRIRSLFTLVLIIGHTTHLRELKVVVSLFGFFLAQFAQSLSHTLFHSFFHRITFFGGGIDASLYLGIGMKYIQGESTVGRIHI